MARPTDYTPEDFDNTVDSYFALRSNKEEPPTKSGLLLRLNISRQTWANYKERPEFLDTIKRAELLIEEAWVQRLTQQACTGAIFYLKNAFKEDYRDSKDITSDGKALPTPIMGGVTKEDVPQN